MKLFGFNDDALTHQDPLTANYEQTIGANVARMPLWWSAPDKSPAQDAAVAALRARGIKSILHMSAIGGAVIDSQQYGLMVAKAAARFPDAIIECVNEPNYSGFWGVSPGTAAIVNDAAAAAAPGRVISSAVAPYPPSKVDAPDGYFAYQDAMLGSMKNRDKLLGFSVHFYPPWYDPSWQLFDRAIPRTRKWAVRDDQKVYVTEWNLRSDIYNGSTPERPAQAPTAGKLVTQMNQDSRVKAGIWHRLRPASNPDIARQEVGNIWAMSNSALTYALWGAFSYARRI
jgi:hypothetical protein